MATITVTDPNGNTIEEKLERLSSPTIQEFKAKAK